MPEESIIIDPVGMNIVNRIAAGTKASGTQECAGGMLVQGCFEGTLVVSEGPLVLMQDGVICGDIVCRQDAYLFGTIAAKPDGTQSQLTVSGAVFLAETLNATADITAGVFKTYEGAQIEGRIKTVRRVAA
jgi:cytoskeletal protein CcmA (bactofilin family)